ncbi:MAG: hypothetical protein VYD19_08645 [Myxococcota bacterium]|nr:hypothetical protein [Myxococcota bacterium]
MAGLLLIAACQEGEDQTKRDRAPESDAAFVSATPPQECAKLFGIPSESTGLDESLCAPQCDCEIGGFVAPSYLPEEVERLKAAEELSPPAPLVRDPYLDPLPPTAGVGFCALQWVEEGRYQLSTFPTQAAIAEVGAQLTHSGPCGLCSSLRDLAVYIEKPDLTDPVRRCGLAGLNDLAQTQGCLEELGFSSPCASIWAYNVQHTRQRCLEPCLAALRSPHHEEDGRLNACLSCDEEESGPVFKAIAGRTRRGSGLPSALCRPCETVTPVIHRYGAGRE